MKKRLFAAAVCVVLCMSMAACSDQKDNTIAESSSQAVSQKEELTAQQLRESIVGNWGRLDEVMHEFYDDNTCVVGGMFGDYEIEDDRRLVMTTSGGTKTEYYWNDTSQFNNWLLDGDTLTVNGNQFTRIIDETDS